MLRELKNVLRVQHTVLKSVRCCRVNLRPHSSPSDISCRGTGHHLRMGVCWSLCGTYTLSPERPMRCALNLSRVLPEIVGFHGSTSRHTCGVGCRRLNRHANAWRKRPANKEVGKYLISAGTRPWMLSVRIAAESMYSMVCSAGKRPDLKHVEFARAVW